jgi:hypothetical protein
VRSSEFSFDLLTEADPVLVAVRSEVDFLDRASFLVEFQNFLRGTESEVVELRYWDCDSGSVYQFTWQSSKPLGEPTHWYLEEFASRFQEATSGGSLRRS